MVNIARQPVVAPRIPWRSIALTVLLAGLLLAMIAALVAGTRPNVPNPFGPARNGLVAYSAGGDIFTVDPIYGTATAIVTGPETDLDPRWSRDGVRLVFERKVNGDAGPGQLFTVRAAGSQLTLLTPEPLVLLETYDFSPDGTEVLLSSNVNGSRTMSIAKADGSGVRTLDLQMVTAHPQYRPADGGQISFVGLTPSVGRYGLYVVNSDGSDLRTLIDPVDHDFDVDDVMWSPDGSRIAYTATESPWGTRAIHVMSVDGTMDRTIELGSGVSWARQPAWSNDGTRLLMVHGSTLPFEGVPAVVSTADLAGPGVEIAHAWTMDRKNTACCPLFEWAPDDSSILATPGDSSGRALQQLLWDPVNGTSRPAPWTSTSDPAWQRLAP
jgi:Tol biopolymer transport system component